MRHSVNEKANILRWEQVVKRIKDCEMSQLQKKSETNRRLGYADDARLLIINADDFGMCQAVNEAICRTLKAGVVQTTTLMVPCAWAVHAMHWLGEVPDIAFGVHLTAIGDSAKYRWRPVTCQDKVSSLVDETGHFYSSDRIPEFLAKATLDELEVEFRAQIETVLGAKLKPTHVDWHSLRIARRPEIFDVMFGLAREYGLAARVRERPLIEKVQRQGLPSNDYDFLDSYELDPARKSTLFAQLLRDLPVGLSEWAVHPGLDTPELLTIEPDGNHVRQSDFDFLMSAEARAIIRQEGITLLSYKPLQASWQGTSSQA
jgi:chitin disaccharide deacetylase